MGLGDNLDVLSKKKMSLLETDPQFLGCPVCVQMQQSRPPPPPLFLPPPTPPLFLLPPPPPPLHHHHHHHDYKGELLRDNCFFVIENLEDDKPFEE